jgi:hypothetical protein
LSGFKDLHTSDTTGSTSSATYKEIV